MLCLCYLCFCTCWMSKQNYCFANTKHMWVVCLVCVRVCIWEMLWVFVEFVDLCAIWKSWEIVSRAQGITEWSEKVEILAQSRIPEKCVSPNFPIYRYIPHAHTHKLNRYSRTRCRGEMHTRAYMICVFACVCCLSMTSNGFHNSAAGGRRLPAPLHVVEAPLWPLHYGWRRGSKLKQIHITSIHIFEVCVFIHMSLARRLELVN